MAAIYLDNDTIGVVDRALATTPPPSAPPDSTPRVFGGAGGDSGDDYFGSPSPQPAPQVFAPNREEDVQPPQPAFADLVADYRNRAQYPAFGGNGSEDDALPPTPAGGYPSYQPLPSEQSDPFADALVRQSPSAYAAGLAGIAFDPWGAAGAPDPGAGPFHVGQLLSPFTLGIPGAAMEPAGAAALGFGLGAQQVADRALPEDTNPLVRFGIDSAAALGGGLAGHAWAGQGFPAGASIRDVSQDAEMLDRTNKIRAAKGLPPLDTLRAPTVEAPPVPTREQQIAELSQAFAPEPAQPPPPVDPNSQGAQLGNALIERARANGYSPLANAPVEPGVRLQSLGLGDVPNITGDTTPQIAQPSLLEQAQAASQRGANMGRGSAEGAPVAPPAFPDNPLGFTPEEIAAHGVVPEGVGGVPGGGIPPEGPTPTQIAGASGSGPPGGGGEVPPAPFGDQARRWADQQLSNLRSRPIQAVNDTARSLETIGDVAAPGRLAPTAGLYMPKVYAESLGDLAGAELSKNPKEFIQQHWDGINADPDMQALGITVDDMFSRDGFGLHGAGTDPYSGEVKPGGGMGVLAKNQRAQLLGNWMQMLRPDMLREQILNKIRGAGDEVAQQAERERIMNDPAYRAELGRSIDLVTGHSQWRPLGDDTSLIVNFGNWFAAQAELITRGAVGGAKGVANLVPGVDVPVSASEAVARTALGRLAAVGTAATVALNMAQGVKPSDDRAFRNGIPMVVINPIGGNGPHIPGFAPNTQWDLMGPIGEFIQHAAGVGRAAYEGATGTGGSAMGALSGAGGEAAFWARGQLAYVPKLITDLMTGSNFGEKPSLANEAPLPFNVSGFVGDNQRAPGTTIASSFGGRFHEPSLFQQQSDQLRADPNYGAAPGDPTWSPLMAARLAKDPKYAGSQAAIQQQTYRRADAGNANAQDVVAKQGVNDQRLTQEAAAAKLFDPQNPKSFRDMLSNINLQTQAKQEQADRDYQAVAQGAKPPPTDPNKAALYQYYQALDANRLPGGKLDGEGFDTQLAEIQKAWTPDQQAYVTEQTGIEKEHGSPLVSQYYRDAQAIRDSGYFDARKQAYDLVTKQAGLPSATSTISLVKALTPTYGAEAAPIVASKVDAAVNKMMESWRLAPSHKAVAQLIYKWGYGGGAKEKIAAGATP